MPIQVQPRQAARAAYLAAAMNLAAALAMLIALRPGLPVAGSHLPERMQYVAAETTVWWGGWLLWHAAAISLLAFYVGLAGLWCHRSPILTTLALLCAAAGLASDISAEALYMGMAPRLGPGQFLLAEGAAGVLTGYAGNGLYTVAGILLTWAGARDLPGRLVALAIPLWAAGLCLSAASLIRSPSGQFWSTAVLMPLFVLWAGLVGRWLGSRES